MKRLCLIVILIAILTDQISKYYADVLIDKRESIEIASFIKLAKVWNSGISFGMLKTLPYGSFLFSTLSILIISILLYLIYKSSDKLTCFSFSLIIGGAIGNVVDRICFGAVYDFIYFHLNNWYWPAFNLADMYIACGMFISLYKWYIYDFIISNESKK